MMKALSRALLAVGIATIVPVQGVGAQAEDPLKAAVELHDAGKVKEAIPLYDKIIKAAPKSAAA